MKTILFAVVFLNVVALFLPLKTQAQTEFLMSNSKIQTCSGIFLDSGGLSDGYQNGEYITQTICPDRAEQQVLVLFSDFYTERNYDYLAVYNGQSSNSPPVKNGNMDMALTGQLDSPIARSTDVSGCLTFHFTTDGSGTAPGWLGQISCVNPSTPTACFGHTPSDGASAGVLQKLIWRPQPGVDSYDVYFGTDLNPPLVSENQFSTEYTPSELIFGEIYFWKAVPHGQVLNPADECGLHSFNVGHTL